MTHFTPHSVTTAPTASKPLLEDIKKTVGFVPNLLGTMAQAPAMLEGYTTLASIFDKTDLSEAERQIILMTNSRLNGCTYCMVAHTSLSQMAGVANDVIEALRAGTPIANPKLEALRTFATVINESRGWPTQADIKDFLAAGYNQQNILEVIQGTALKVMSNYTNHIAQTDLDSAFAPNAWSPSASQVA
ncbi:MAG: carboxymuconolactone decarboxylase family protein [Pseudomonadota bacterium]